MVNKTHNNDLVTSFIFEGLPIIGRLILLKNSWNKIANTNKLTPSLDEILSQLTICSIFFGSSLKFPGSASVQLQELNSGFLAFAECTSDLKIRGTVKTQNKISPNQIIKQSKLAVNIKTLKDNKSYQSIIPVTDSNIEKIFKNYLEQSEQVKSNLLLRNSIDYKLGLFLQQLPKDESENSANITEMWNLIDNCLTDFITPKTTLNSTSEYLELMFPNFSVKKFKEEEVTMECSCSRIKVEQLITVLGKNEAFKLLEEEGTIKITCDLCQKIEEFNKIEIENLFKEE